MSMIAIVSILTDYALLATFVREYSMLLEFGTRNFFSFKEGALVTFRLDANCPRHISQGLSFTPVLCVKGANGSGKTHLLKAIAFLVQFCSSSFDNTPRGPIAVQPFFDSQDPCDFTATFSVNDSIYTYELSTTEQSVVRETIYRTIAKKSKIVERTGNKITFVTKEFNGLTSMILRENASIISTANQYGLKELKEVHTFFAACASNVSYGGLRERPLDSSTVCGLLKDDEDAFAFVKSFIRDCDVGISDIKIMTRDDDDGKGQRHFPVFIHSKDGKENPVFDTSESSGTKALFRNLGIYDAVLRLGGVLILDEFDINLHPHILPKLIDLFLDQEINKRQAQLVFSTHNTEIIDVLGRYRTCLVNKDDNESYVYRLDELPGSILRNDRPISPVYKEGRIGGVPRL